MTNEYIPQALLDLSEIIAQKWSLLEGKEVTASRVRNELLQFALVAEYGRLKRDEQVAATERDLP